MKIGIYQSVIPVPVDRSSATVVLGNDVLRFNFKDSGETDAGVPVYVAESVEVFRI